MIVDTSAIMAIVLDEPERDGFLTALARAGSRTISAGNWVELGAVIVRKKLPALEATLLVLRTEFAIEVAPVTLAQADLGRVAYSSFGQGTGHPAKLNFGDCFAYALAKDTGEPLLFKGNDFIHTDIEPAA